MPAASCFIALLCAAVAAPAYAQPPAFRPADVSWAYEKSEGIGYGIYRFFYEGGKEVDVDREVMRLRDAGSARALGVRLNRMGEARKKKMMGWLTDKECLIAGACHILDAQQDSNTRAVIEWKGCHQPRPAKEPPATTYRERRCFLAGVFSDIYQITTPECESCGDTGYLGVKHELASRGRARLSRAQGVEIPGSYYEALALLAEGTREDMDSGYALLSAIQGMGGVQKGAVREIEFHLAGIEFDKYLAELTEAFESAYSRLYRDCGALSELRVIEESCNRFLSFSPNPTLGAIRAVCRACDIEFGGKAGGKAEWQAILSDLASFTQSTETLEFFKGLASYKLGQCPDVDEYFKLVTSDPGYRLAAAYCRTLCPLEKTDSVKILEGLVSARDSGTVQDGPPCFTRHFLAEFTRSERILVGAANKDRARELDALIARGATDAEVSALLFARYGILRPYEEPEDGAIYLKAGQWAYGRRQYGLALTCYDRAREVQGVGLTGSDAVRRLECRLHANPPPDEEIAAVDMLRGYSNSRDREIAKLAFDALMRYSGDVAADRVAPANTATPLVLARWAHEWGEYAAALRLFDRAKRASGSLGGEDGNAQASCMLQAREREDEALSMLSDRSLSAPKEKAGAQATAILATYARGLREKKGEAADVPNLKRLASWARTRADYCLAGLLLERLNDLDPGFVEKNGINLAECRLYCPEWTGRETDEIRKLMDWSNSDDRKTADRSSALLQRYSEDVISKKIQPRDPAVPSLLADWN